MNTLTPIEILLVEDNPGDARLAKEALKDSKLLNNIHHVVDGEQAIQFLRKEGDYQDAVRPDIVLLDLNLPRKDGREVLADIKNDPELQTIPVVVLTTSEAEQDIVQSYKLHANCYITKPVDLDKFLQIIDSMQDFWLSIVRLPGHAAAE
jgi:two-component system, chemotaxis family, response regulator Rcp1